MRTCSLFLSYFCIALICVCCHDDDTTSSEKTIRLTAEDDYSAIWAVFSDNSGNVLQWKALANRSQNEFKYTLQENVTLTLIFKGGNSTRLRTYTHIAPGDYTVGYGLDSETSQSVGNYKIDISDPDEYVYLYPESEGNCGGFLWEPFSAHIDFPICESPSNFYLALNTPYDDVPRYYYNPQIHSSEGITINDEFVSLLPKMKSKVITFDKPVYGSSLVYGVTLKKKRYFNTSFTAPANSTKLFPIYYPDLTGTLFSDYLFRLYFYSDEKIKNVVYKRGIEPPASFPALDVNFNFADSVNISSEKIAFPVTGSADYVLTAFRYRSNTVTGTWYVFSDFSNDMSIRLPVFPSDLKSAIDLTFISALKKTQVTFVENKQIGYEGFYASLLQKKDAQIDPMSEQRQKTYLFGNGFYEVSLGARKANGFKQPPYLLPDLASQTNPAGQDQ